MDKAKELYERGSIFIKQNPDFCQLDEDKFTKFVELYDTGAITIMKERDALGRRIVVCKTKKFDSSKCTVEDTLRLFINVLSTMSLEEETQKHGMIFINDLTGLNASHLKLFPYRMLTNYSSYMNISVIRIKEIYIVGIPSFAVHIFKAVRCVLDDKNKNRLKVMSDVDNLWKYVDQSVMTKDYGGPSYTDDEALADFRKIIISKKDELFKIACGLEVNLDVAKKFHKMKSLKSKKTMRNDELLEFD